MFYDVKFPMIIIALFLILLVIIELVISNYGDVSRKKMDNHFETKLMDKAQKNIYYIRDSIKVIENVAKRYPKFAHYYNREIDFLEDYRIGKVNIQMYLYDGDSLFIHTIRENGGGFILPINCDMSRDYNLETIANQLMHETIHLIDYSDVTKKSKFSNEFVFSNYLINRPDDRRKMLLYTEQRAYTAEWRFFCLAKEYGYFKSFRSNDEKSYIEENNERLVMFLNRKNNPKKLADFFQKAVEHDVEMTDKNQ